MSFRPSSKVWLALGASLAVSGGFLIVASLPEGGQTLWIGVGLIAVGSLSLRLGLDSAAGQRDTSSVAVHRQAGSRAATSNIEPELLGPSPRKVEMTHRGKTVVLVWTLTLAVFAVLAHRHFGLLSPPEMRSRLESEGRSSQAEVHSLESREIADGRTLYFVGYNFRTESEAPVRISRSVPLRVFTRLEEGDITEVVYFPGNPELHYLPDLTSPVPTGAVVFAGALLLAAAGFVEAQRRLHQRLVASGTAVSGFTADVRRRGGVRSFLVNYDIGGVRQTLKARERNPNLRNGQPATVLYDPAAATRAVIYRLALYRVRT